MIKIELGLHEKLAQSLGKDSKSLIFQHSDCLNLFVFKFRQCKMFSNFATFATITTIT